MADVFTAEKRSWIMSQVKNRDSKAEMVVRKLLFSKGFRYRLHVSGLPGKPDIVLPKHNAVIFVNGCFWHGHKGCKRAKLPDTNTEFWENKIDENKMRDKKATRELKKLRWRVLVIWEDETKNTDDLAKKLNRFFSKGVQGAETN